MERLLWDICVFTTFSGAGARNVHPWPGSRAQLFSWCAWPCSWSSPRPGSLWSHSRWPSAHQWLLADTSPHEPELVPIVKSPGVKDQVSRGASGVQCFWRSLDHQTWTWWNPSSLWSHGSWHHPAETSTVFWSPHPSLRAKQNKKHECPMVTVNLTHWEAMGKV